MILYFVLTMFVGLKAGCKTRRLYLETSLHTARPSSRGWREPSRDSRRRHSSWLGSVETNVKVSYISYM